MGIGEFELWGGEVGILWVMFRDFSLGRRENL